MSVYPDHSCAESDDDVVPVRAASHLGGSLNSGGRKPRERSDFFIFLFENCSIQKMIKDCYPSLHSMMSAAAPDGAPPRRFSNSKL